MSSNVVLFLLFIGAMLEAAGDGLFKQWANAASITPLAAGFFIHSVGTAFFVYSLKHSGLGVAHTAFSALNVVACVIVGVICYGEHLAPMQKLGVALALTSLVCLGWE